MVDFLSWLWGWFTFSLWWGSLFALVISLFFAIHPVLFRLKLRLSRVGQRGEFWVSHLFGIIRLGTVASRRSQTLILECGPWKKVLKRWGKPVDLPPFRAPPSSAKRAEPVEPTKRAEPAEPFRASKSSEPNQEPPTTSTLTKPYQEPVASESGTPDSTFKGGSKPPERSKIETVPTERKPSSQGSADAFSFDRSEPPKISAIGQGEGHDKNKDKGKETGPGFLDRIRSSVKKTRERIRTLYWKFRDKTRLIRRVWGRASPIFWRFWFHMSGAFSHRVTGGSLRVGFPQVHLTGVFTGMFYQAQGLFFPKNVCVKFEPVFSGSSFYCRTDTSVGIHPWRILYAFAFCLFDSEVWRGSWDLWKAYRRRRKKQADSKK